jgi:hypothetical protein
MKTIPWKCLRHQWWYGFILLTSALAPYFLANLLLQFAFGYGVLPGVLVYGVSLALLPFALYRMARAVVIEAEQSSTEPGR